MMIVLTGHTSKETAYLVEDYPYGFVLRCKIRYWIETKPGHGSRVVSQTTNPKRGDIWNTPKASTYSPIRVLYLNTENGHVENDGLHIYADTAKIAAFEAAYGDGLASEHDQKTLRMLKALAARDDARMALRATTTEGGQS